MFKKIGSWAKSAYQTVKNNAYGFAVGATGFVASAMGIGGFSSNANAAVDASVATTLTGITTDAGTLSADVTPVVIGIIALMLTLKLTKRFLNKV